MDGICPKCNIRPKKPHKGRKYAPYCEVCTREYLRRYYNYKGGTEVREAGLCITCRTEPRLKYAPQCKTCRRKERKVDEHAVALKAAGLCSRCEVNPRQKNHSWCKSCRNKRRRTWMQTPRGKKSIKRNRWAVKFGKEAVSVIERLQEEQGNKCAICGRNPEDQKLQSNHNGRVKALAVDHDHNNGRIRGLLCDLCNRAIGMMGDSPNTLRKAAEYLERAAV